jgi:TPR repeat protein
MNKLFFVLALLFVTEPLTGHSQELKCLKGGNTVQTDYLHAIRIIKKGTRLSETQEMGVIHTLEDAVKNQCHQAALILADIRINQAAALPKGTSQHTLDEFDEKILALLLEAGKIGEGRFELGGFYFSTDSKYFSPENGVRILEDAGRDGDKKAIEMLADIYENGLYDIAASSEKAKYWKARIKSVQ